MNRFIAFFLASFILCAGVDTSAATLKQQRIAILDCSTSMNELEKTSRGNFRRIDIAKEELLKIARQVPPSAESPLSLILFTETASSQNFTDLPAFERAVNAAQPHGGTHISAGLRAAREILEKAPVAQSFYLLLFTDAEDHEPGGDAKILAEETALDRIFASRQQQGLATNVVCKRWANASSSLISRVAMKPHWGLIDAQDLQMTTLTPVAIITPQQVKWLDQNRLQVELAGRAEIRGTAAKTPSQIKVRCLNVDPAGQSDIALPVAAIPQKFSITVDAKSCLAPDGRGHLKFAIRPITPYAAGNQLLIPSQLAELIVKFDPPQRIRRIQLSATLKPKTSKWTDPAKRQVSTDATLELKVIAADGSRDVWPAGVQLQVETVPGATFLNSPPPIEIQRPGITTWPLTVNWTAPAHAKDGEIVVRLVAAQTSTDFTLEPLPLSASCTITLPSPVVTKIKLQPGTRSAGRWTNVASDLATFEFPLFVSVQGHSHGEQFTIVAPPAIHFLELNPTVLHSGDQTVQVRLIARVTALQVSPLQLELVPPPASDTIQYVVAGPVDVQLLGPPPLKLALADSAGLVEDLRFQLGDGDESLAPELTAGLLDAPADLSTGGLAVQLSSQGALGHSVPANVTLGETFVVQLHLPSTHQQSFWRDASYDLIIDAKASPQVTSVSSSVTTLQVVAPAPFKKWMFYLTVILGIAAFFLGPVFVFMRYRRTSYEPAD